MPTTNHVAFYALRAMFSAKHIVLVLFQYIVMTTFVAWRIGRRIKRNQRNNGIALSVARRINHHGET